MTAHNTMMERRRSRRRMFANSRPQKASSSNSTSMGSNDSLLMKTISINPHHHRRLSSLGDEESWTSGLSSITGSFFTPATVGSTQGVESPFAKVFDSEVPPQSQNLPLRPTRQGSVRRVGTFSADSTGKQFQQPPQQQQQHQAGVVPQSSRHPNLTLGHHRNAPLPQRQESIPCHLGMSSGRSMTHEEAMHQSCHTFAKYSIERDTSARTLDEASWGSLEEEDSFMDSASTIGTLDEVDEDEEEESRDSTHADPVADDAPASPSIGNTDDRTSLISTRDASSLQSGTRHLAARRRAGSWAKPGRLTAQSGSAARHVARRKRTDESPGGHHKNGVRHLTVYGEERSHTTNTTMIAETSEDTETEASEREALFVLPSEEAAVEQRMNIDGDDDDDDDDESVDDSRVSAGMRNACCGYSWNCAWLFRTPDKQQ